MPSIFETNRHDIPIEDIVNHYIKYDILRSNTRKGSPLEVLSTVVVMIAIIG
jgi:hypothetical protein